MVRRFADEDELARAIVERVGRKIVLALPLGADETATLYAAQHDDLHRLATSLGVAVWMGAVLQAQ